jgi:hypothetical protein
MYQLGDYGNAIRLLPVISNEEPYLMGMKGSHFILPLALFTYPTNPNNPIDWLEIVSNRPPAEYLILDGLQLKNKNQWRLSLLSFRIALAVAPQVYEKAIYRHYYQVLSKSDKVSDRSVANNILQMLDNDKDLNKGYLLLDSFDSLSTLTIEIGENFTCPRIAGFAYDEAALESGPLIPVKLTIWGNSNTSESLPPETSDGFTVLNLLAVNLIPNSGFEWDEQDYPAYPLGHESSVYLYDDLSMRSLAIDQRNNQMTQVAEFANTIDWAQASFSPVPIQVVPSHYYLQSSLAKNKNGRGQMALFWRNKNIRQRLFGDYQGIPPSSDWESYTQIVQSPENGYFVDAFIGFQSSVEGLKFDNHLLINLPSFICED